MDYKHSFECFYIFFPILAKRYTNFMLQPSFGNSISSFYENLNLSFLSVLVFVLFSLLWLLTLLTLISLYKSHKRSLKLNRRVKTKISSEKQMSLVQIFMVVAFTFSLLPTLYNHTLFCISKNYVASSYVKRTNSFVSFLFLYTNSIWNILVYNVINKKFRSTFKALFKKKLAESLL